MNKKAALSVLGLNDSKDRVRAARAYGERLAVLQDKLMSAQSEQERSAHGVELAELGKAYEMLTGTGHRAKSGEAAATVMRSGTVQPPALPADAFVRMEPSAVIAGRLEIGALLGEGGMGCVYAARDRLKGENVAIKVLRHDLQFSSAAKYRFLAEAKVSCSLSHPIVRVHDVGVSGGIYYLSMERLKGHTLRHQIDQFRKKNRAFRIAEVTDIAHQLAEMQLPRSRPFRVTGLVLIGVGLAASGYAAWKYPDWESKLSAVATALKAELAGTGASAAAEAEPSDAGSAEGLISVEVPPPEAAWVATTLSEPESQSALELKTVPVPDSESEPNSESAPGLDEQPHSEPEQLPSSVVELEPEPEASLQAPAQPADAVRATPTGEPTAGSHNPHPTPAPTRDAIDDCDD